MRKRGRTLGVVLTLLGLIIILSILLPSGTLWFLFGIGLMLLGICILRR